MITDKQFEKYLNTIGGLENGWGACPNKYVHPVRYRLFQFFDWVGFAEKRNPFRDRIYGRGFFSVGAGWLPLVKSCIEELISIGWNKEISQVKEKFGGLRFYTNGLPENGRDIINKYERLSFRICEDCGKPGTVRKGPWVRTLCDDCCKSK